MTIGEAIRYYEQLAENQIKCADRIDELHCDSTTTRYMAEHHRQLAEWLRELRHLRNITEYLKDMVTCFEFMDSMHYNEDIIKWAESELSVDMQEVNADEDSD